MVANIVLAVAGGAVLLLTSYLLAVSIATFFYRPPARPFRATHSLAVLVPAHNEAELIGRCLGSLLSQSYPPCLYRVIVIADNCTDHTADLAEAIGVEVMVRTDPANKGKGQALRWAMDRLLREPAPPDAVVVVDADSLADRHLLTELNNEFQEGNEVVQAEYLIERPSGSSARSELAAAAFLLFHRVRFSGRAALGMPANLVGNGMLFSRAVLQRCPWNAFSGVEDLEYSIELRLHGIRPVFAAMARVYGPAAADAGARSQRRRWEGGRFHVMRRRLLPLVTAAIRRRDWTLLDAALDLSVPPLGLLAMATWLGLAISLALLSAGVANGAAVLPWVLASVAVPLHVGLGLRAANAPAQAYRALLQAPLFLLRKLPLYAGLLGGLDANRWERTARPGENPATPGRFELSGVPIDALTMDETLARLDQALRGPALTQVCTINLDFVVKAHADADLRRLFRESQMNVPDGFPVVWLGRLLGHHVPGRVAGADLVPLLMGLAAERRARVYLLGGEGGVAARAAARLRQRFPGLQVAGWYEPPRAAIDAMDNTTILRLIADSRADILLVALGHPKQDQWIDRHRQSLPVAIAIGVGCCLDLIAGQVQRAPQWMQRAGLEWLFRLQQEPARLFSRYAVDAGWLFRFSLTATWSRLRA